MKFNDYSDLKKGLETLPSTRYPALILHMVAVAYKKNVFTPGGASVFVRKIEDQKNALSGRQGKMAHKIRYSATSGFYTIYCPKILRNIALSSKPNYCPKCGVFLGQ